MFNLLLPLHVILGELGVFFFLWVFVELLNLSQKNLQRTKIVSVIGLAMLLLAWIVGGTYYVSDYGSIVKPVIKAGPADWTHKIIMETKEHIFFFLPILAAIVCLTLWKKSGSLLQDEKTKKNLLILSGLIVLIGLSIALMGALISIGYRVALEALNAAK